MNKKQLANEINESLQRNAGMLFRETVWSSSTVDSAEALIGNMLKACANNIAEVYADRIQDEPDELLHGPLED